MQRYWLSAITVTLAMAFVPLTAQAQDPLEALVKNKSLSRRDQARIEAEVGERVSRLKSAGTTEERREKARDRLISTAKIKGATSEGRAEYAKACGNALSGLVADEDFTVAFDAVMVLVELDNAETGSALSRGLRSSHAAVRYLSARGLRSLHKQLAGDRTCGAVLRELGRCGAKEKDDVVLTEVYKAINFSADVPRFTKADDAADALNRIFVARTKSVLSGSRDEMLDEPGYGAAVACYGSASPEKQAALIHHMQVFLQQAVERFFDADTAPAAKPTLADLVVAAEEAIRAMLQASKVQPPGCRLKDIVQDRRPKLADAEACLESLGKILDGAPWK